MRSQPLFSPDGMAGVRRAASRLWCLLADLVAVIDPVFLALALRRGADAARTRRRFAASQGHLGSGVVVVALHRLEIEAGASVQDGCLLHCGGQDWSAGAGRIHLGARSYVGHHCVLYGAGEIHIGADVLLGPGVVITSQGHTFDDAGSPIRQQPHILAPVHIAEDVWIGAGALILPGVRIGRGAVVAAGAVVTRDVAALDKVAGVPARVVGRRGVVGRA